MCVNSLSLAKGQVSLFILPTERGQQSQRDDYVTVSISGTCALDQINDDSSPFQGKPKGKISLPCKLQPSLLITQQTSQVSYTSRLFPTGSNLK